MTRAIDIAFLALSRNAGRAMLLSIGLVILFAWQIRAPEYAGSISELISAQSPALVAAEQIAAARGDEQTLLVLVEAADETIGAAFERLERVESRLAACGVTAEIRSLHSLRDQLFVFGLDENDALADLLAALRGAGEELSLVARDADSYSVAVTVADAAEAEALQLLRQIDFGAGRAQFLAGAGLEMDVASGLRRDLRILIPAIVFVMLATAWVAFRHRRALILPAYASVASAVVTFSVLSVLGVSINLVTLLALPVVLIVALANCCHFLARADRVDEDGGRAVTATLALVAVPYLASCVTTSVALASLAFNSIDPIRDLGVVTSISLMSSFVLILLAAPWALRSYLGVSVRPPSRLYRSVSRYLHRGRRWVATVLLASAAMGILVTPSVKVQSDPRIFFPDNAGFTQAFQLFEQQFFVFAPVRVLVRAADGDGIDVGMLQFASSLRADLGAAPGAIQSDLRPASGNSGFLLTTYVVDEASERSLLAFIAERGQQVRDEYALVASSSMTVYESIDGMAMASLGDSLGISVVIIFGVILLLFRSVRVMVSSVIANSVPLAGIVAVIWLIDDPLNLVTAFVFLVALGVIVDYTIHILWRDRAGEAVSGSSIEYSVILSTVMLCLGLLLCQLSDFPTTRQFAGYCALALTGAVISNLTILPTLLRYRGSKQSARSSR